MLKKIIKKDDEKIIILLAKGIVGLYESGERQNNFSLLPRELKRGINILAASYNLIINDRTEMIEVFSEEINKWFKGKCNYLNEKIIEGGYPSDFCYELAIDTRDIEGELDQQPILEIINKFKLYGKENDYVKFRVFLIENPIVTKDKVNEFILKNAKYDANLKKVYSKIEDFYEEVPKHYILDDDVEICGYCGWTIRNDGHNKKCISKYCKANDGIQKSKSIKVDDSFLRVKRGVMRYICLPGIPELNLKKKLEKLKVNVKLYPNFDEYDLEIEINKEKWAIDVKDYGNPYALVNRVTDFKANICDKSFIVVPNLRYRFNKDYKYILDSQETEGFKFIIERNLIKMIKEKL